MRELEDFAKEISNRGSGIVEKNLNEKNFVFRFIRKKILLLSVLYKFLIAVINNSKFF